jgi:hypothetical protein
MKRRNSLRQRQAQSQTLRTDRGRHGVSSGMDRSTGFNARLPRNHECRWPFGDPKKPDFHYCHAPACTDRPYCPEHCRAAYIPNGSPGARHEINRMNMLARNPTAGRDMPHMILSP